MSEEVQIQYAVENDEGTILIDTISYAYTDAIEKFLKEYCCEDADNYRDAGLDWSACRAALWKKQKYLGYRTNRIELRKVK